MANNNDSEGLHDGRRHGNIGSIFRRYDFKENLGATPPKGEVLNRRLTRSTKRRVAFEKAAANNGADDTLLYDSNASGKANAAPSQVNQAPKRLPRSGIASPPKKSCMKIQSHKALLEAKKIIDEGRQSSRRITTKTKSSVRQPAGSHFHAVKPLRGNDLAHPASAPLTTQVNTAKDDDSSTPIISSRRMKKHEVDKLKGDTPSLRSQMQLCDRSNNASHDVYRAIHRQALQPSIPIKEPTSCFRTDGSNFQKELVRTCGVEGTTMFSASAAPRSTTHLLAGSRRSNRRPYLLYASVLTLLLGSAAVWVFPDFTASLGTIQPPVFEDKSMVQCKHWKSLVKGWSDLDSSPIRLAGNRYRVSDVASGLGIEGNVEDHAALVATCGGLQVIEDATEGMIVGMH